MADDRKVTISTKPISQNVILENREKLKVTGVIDIESFNDECIVALTELGKLIVHGKGLKIKNLNLENTDLSITGSIYCCEYNDKGKGKNTGITSKLFK